MKETIRLIVVLSVICIVAGLLLGIVNDVTVEPIRRAAVAKKQQAIKKVLPADTPEPVLQYVVEESGQTNTYYVARRNGEFVACALESSSKNGYGGTIELMVGLTAEGALHGISILKQQETPGLGAKIAKDDFQNQMRGLPLQGTTWKVSKDGGDIDAITAATISSRAVCEAIRSAVERFTADKARIVASL